MNDAMNRHTGDVRVEFHSGEEDPIVIEAPFGSEEWSALFRLAKNWSGYDRMNSGGDEGSERVNDALRSLRSRMDTEWGKVHRGS